MIKRIDAYSLKAPEPHYRGAERCVTVVRAETDDGIVGWGEGISQFPEAALASKVLIDEGFAPMVLGRDPIDVERIWNEMCRYAYWFGVEGVAAFAISAIDLALWDVKGKVLGQPVAKLLGQLKDEVPAMASIIFDMDDLDWTLNEFRGFVDAGYKISKAGWGMKPDSLFGYDGEKDVRYVREVRAVIGDEMSLVVDVPGAKGPWDVPTAIRRFKELQEFDLRWIEQPLPPGDLKGHKRLRDAVCTPVGTGEDEWSPETYQRVIESEGVDVLQLDPGRCLGITGCLEVVNMVEAADMKCTAHTWSSALNTAASLAFLASTESSDTLDLKPHESPLQHELVEDPWEQKNGMLALRATPGLGVTVRESVVDKYRFGK
jgi:L-alanine-DL-glutamate epimerase-like enolase superfamily enzyme